MTSQDDLTLLKQMYQRGEITDEQYDVLRRHVLWGTPLPQLIDEVPPRPTPAPPPGRPDRRDSAPAAPPLDYSPAAYLPPAQPARSASDPAPRRAPDPGYPPAEPGSRRARREAAEAAEAPSAYLPPVGPGPHRDDRPAYLPPADPGARREDRPPYLPPADPGARREDRPPYLPPADPGARRGRGPEERAAYQPSAHRPPVPSDYSPAAYLPPAGPERRPEGAAAGERPAHLPPPPATDYSPSAYLPPARPDAPSWPGRPEEPAYPPAAEPGSRRGRRETRVERGPADEADYSPAAYLPAAEPGSRRARREAGDDSAVGGAAGPGSRRARREAGEDPAAAGPGSRRAGRDDQAGTGSRRARRADRDTPADPGERREPGDAPRPPRKRRRRSLVAVLTSVLLALALVAAGVYWFALRESGVPPADYARSVCGSVRDWQQQVDSTSSTLVGSVAQQQDPTVVRTSVTTFYTDAAGRTDQLRTALLDIGVADVSGGQAYADSLASAVGDQATALRGLSARAARLDPTARATFQIQLQSLLTGAQTAVSAVTAALARPAAGTPAALRTALGAEPSCAPYVG